MGDSNNAEGTAAPSSQDVGEISYPVEVASESDPQGSEQAAQTQTFELGDTGTDDLAASTDTANDDFAVFDESWVNRQILQHALGLGSQPQSATNPKQDAGATNEVKATSLQAIKQPDELDNLLDEVKNLDPDDTQRIATEKLVAKSRAQEERLAKMEAALEARAQAEEKRLAEQASAQAEQQRELVRKQVTSLADKVRGMGFGQLGKPGEPINQANWTPINKCLTSARALYESMLSVNPKLDPVKAEEVALRQAATALFGPVSQRVQSTQVRKAPSSNRQSTSPAAGDFREAWKANLKSKLDGILRK
jgi:hypothetical protein